MSKPALSALSPAGAPEDKANELLGFEPETPSVEPEVRATEDTVSSAIAVTPTAQPVQPSTAQPVQLPTARPVQHIYTPPEAGSAVSLAELRARGVPIRWFEAVAVVQGLCSALMDAHQETMLVALETVFIRAEGRVFAARAEVHDAATTVRALGGIFDKLADVDLPAPLQFAISKATATPPTYGSVEEFSTGLAYFERPNRAELLQGLYESWRALPAPVVAVLPVAPPPTVEPVPRQAPKESRQSWWKHLNQRNKWIVPGAIATMALIAIGLWSLGSQPPGEETQPTRTATNGSGVSGTTGAGDQVLETAALTSDTARGAAGTDIFSPPRTWIVLPPQSAHSGAAAPGLPPRVGAAPSARPNPSVPARTPESVIFGQSFTDGATYSAADAGVKPPVAVYPKLPTLGPADLDVSGFEIVVTDDGDVESVRASMAPETIGHAMQMTNILSAAKSWRFRPASKDGHPVRYRLLVWLQLH